MWESCNNTCGVGERLQLGDTAGSMGELDWLHYGFCHCSSVSIMDSKGFRNATVPEPAVFLPEPANAGGAGSIEHLRLSRSGCCKLWEHKWADASR